MDWSLLWKAVVILLGGTFLLRIAGRKSISQMTLAQVVIMIGIGSLLVQPLVGKNVWATLTVGLVLVTTLVIIEYGQIRFDFLEKFITGRSKILIENGNINVKNLRKIRLSIDQLEMKLRQSNVSNLNDVHFATLEPNGQLGFILKQSKQNASKEDIQFLLTEIKQLREEIREKYPQTKVVYKHSHYEQIDVDQRQQQNSNQSQQSLFDEVNDKGHQQTPPEYLQ
ncbi:DUF421 domain-containing protein [Bacillus sp. BGMRC 2118]|nr:DUF421 domain-containing protein [Bacillus sp. BGMRC 2118]